MRAKEVDVNEAIPRVKHLLEKTHINSYEKDQVLKPGLNGGGENHSL